MNRTLARVLLAVLGVAVLAIAGVALAASMQPDTVHVERTRTVQAPAEDVRPLLTDFRRFPEWSPWSDLDPDQVSTFSDPASGVGAWYTWKGNDQVGQGRMELTAVSDSRIEQDLDFVEPFPSHAEVAYLVAPTDGGTAVTWVYDQPADFMTKVFGLAVDMDAMLGADFEKGLANLDRLAQASAAERREAERVEAERVEAERAAAAQAEAAAGGEAAGTPGDGG